MAGDWYTEAVSSSKESCGWIKEAVGCSMVSGEANGCVREDSSCGKFGVVWDVIEYDKGGWADDDFLGIEARSWMKEVRGWIKGSVSCSIVSVGWDNETVGWFMDSSSWGKLGGV